MKKNLKKILILASIIALTIGVFYFIGLKTQKNTTKEIANIQAEKQEEIKQEETKQEETKREELINISECSKEFMENYFEEIKEIRESDKKENVLIISSEEKIENTYGATNIVEAPNNQYILQYDSEQEKNNALEELSKKEETIVEENIIREIFAYNSWGIEKTGLDYAIEIADNKEMEDVTVAIIDSGCDMTLFSENYPEKIVETYNVLNPGTELTDETGHGTHIAGTIAEGTPANVKILPIKVTDSKYLYSTDIIEAINYIVYYNKADVINMSFGSALYSVAEYNAIQAANEKKIITVAAAGNESDSVKNYPAANDNTISISSVDSNLQKSDFSSWGSTVTFAAPGTNIVSINGTKSGTSMATPHAVSAVAILKSYNKNLTLDNTIELLKRYAIDLGTEGYDEYYGYGFINFVGAEFYDGSNGDEYNVFKKIGNQTQPIIKIEASETYSPKYNYGNITNLMGATLDFYYTENQYYQKYLYELENIEILGYEPFEYTEQNIIIKHNGKEIPLTVNNTEATTPGWEYTILDNNNIKITKFNCEKKTKGFVYVPENIDGYTVKEIDRDTFDGNESYLVGAVLPDTILQIEEYLFYGCYNLQNVELPQNLTHIGGTAFGSCLKLKTIKIPNNVKIIEDSIFKDCEMLQKVELPKELTKIEYDAFNGCYSLENIEFPEKLEEIEYRAFAGCSSIKKLVIPQNLTTLGDTVFGDCVGLEEIIVEEGNSKYDSRDNCNALIETKTNKILYGSSNTKIPVTVKSIRMAAFKGNQKLTKITIPEFIRKIYWSVFTGCANLQDAVISEGVEEIGDSAFYNCISLKNILIPKTVTSIVNNSFNLCGDDLTLWVHKDSYAETYAKQYGGQYWQYRTISVEVSPIEKTTYNSYETVNADNIYLKVTYDDGTVEVIEDVNIKYRGNKTSFRGEDTYFTVTGYNEMGLFIEKRVEVTVIPEYTKPTNITATEGQKLSQIELPECFEWMDETQEVKGSGNVIYKAKYIPKDTTKYDIVEDIDINIFVKQVTGYTIPIPRKEYKAFETVDTTGMEIDLRYSNGSEETVTEGINIKYTGDNTSFRYGDTSYIVSWHNGTGYYMEKEIEVTVQKAIPQYTIPSGLNAIEGQTLSEVQLPTGFEWMDETQVIEGVGNLAYNAKYIPEDTINYEIVENIEIAINVTRRTISDVKIYGAQKQYKAFEKVNTQNMYIVVTYNNGTTEEIRNNITIKYKNATDSFRYGDTSFSIRASDSNGTIIDRDVPVTVVKAISSYTVPTGISAYVKQQLSQVKLPQNFEWMDKNQTITTVGKQTYNAKFVPADTINYQIVENIKIVIDVKKIVPKYTIPTGLEAISGQKLSQIKLPEGFKWKDETQVISGSGSKAYKARYIPKDTTNYETIENIEIKINVKSSIGSKYVGNINSELITFNVGKNQSGATYVSGQVVVVEWVNGKSTVPRVAPKMKFKSTDGKVELEVFVTPTGTNTYYFDRFIEGIDTSKQYFFEIESGDVNNVSPNKKMNVYFTQTKYNNTIVGKYKDKNIRLLKQNIIFEKDTYIGNINSELMTFNVGKNQSGATYVSGQVVVVEWVNGKSTVPKVAPKMKFKSTDGKVELEVFVTPTGTNTYYFDRFIEGIDTSKQYYFEIASGDSRNISENRKMNVYFTNTKYNNTIVGKYKDKNIRLLKQNIIFEKDTYIGNINSELITFNVGKNQSGATYVSGQVVVVEWVNGKSTVPKVAPKMKFKSTDGKVELEVFVTPTGTNTYYFDRFIEGIDTSKQYYFEIASGDSRNISENRKMNVYFTNTKYNGAVVGMYKGFFIKLLNQNIIFEK